MTPAAAVARRRPARSPALPVATRRFYRRVLEELNAGGFPFLVGGGHALERYLGIGRSVKDLDLFMRERDAAAALAHLERRLGYRTELTFPHWLGKVKRDEHDHIDVIWSSGNSACPVDDDWFRYAVPATVMGQAVHLCPVEETIWSKAYVMERERYDGADIAHLIHARAEQIDWSRLSRRFGQHWRVLLSHLIMFGFVYPSERRRIPEPLMRRCLEILEQEMRQAPARRICRGPLTSRAQYLVDVQLWGYEDARLLPHGSMSEEDASIWTAAIDEAASRPIGADALGRARERGVGRPPCPLLLSARSPRPGPRAPGAGAGSGRCVAAGVLLLAMVVVTRVIDVGSYLEAAQGWTTTLGVLAPAVFVLVYVGATLIGVPGMPFTLLSPLLFGIGPAIVVMIVGKRDLGRARLSHRALSRARRARRAARPAPTASRASPPWWRSTTGP